MAGMAARATIAKSAASIINFLIFFSTSVERDSSVPHVEQRSNPLMNLGPCLYASAVCAVEHDPKSLLPRALGMGRFYSPSCREGSHSRKLGAVGLASNIPFYGAQSSVTPCSCCLLPGHSYICCEDLLRGATGCCRPV